MLSHVGTLKSEAKTKKAKVRKLEAQGKTNKAKAKTQQGQVRDGTMRP